MGATVVKSSEKVQVEKQIILELDRDSRRSTDQGGAWQRSTELSKLRGTQQSSTEDNVARWTVLENGGDRPFH